MYIPVSVHWNARSGWRARSSARHGRRFPPGQELEGVVQPCALPCVEERQGGFDVVLVPGCLRARLEQQDHLRGEALGGLNSFPSQGDLNAANGLAALFSLLLAGLCFLRIRPGRPAQPDIHRPTRLAPALERSP
jgi:hypothetical protein